MGRAIVMVGATSAIAIASARRYAGQGARFLLVARETSAIEPVKQELLKLGATSVDIFTLDFGSSSALGRIAPRAFETLGEVDVVYLAHGLLGQLHRAEESAQQIEELIWVNFTSIPIILAPFIPYFEKRRTGLIIALSSIAGERGKERLLVYSAAKSGLTTYLSGLRNRLYKSGVAVLTVKPGPVKSRMTAAIKQSPLLVPPEKIARSIDVAVRLGLNETYSPWYWRWIILVVRSIPECLFKRVNGW